MSFDFGSNLLIKNLLIDLNKNNKNNKVLIFGNKFNEEKFISGSGNNIFTNHANVNYMEFIKKEVFKYWRLVKSSNYKIDEGILKPTFASDVLIKYLMQEIVDEYRKNKKFFSLNFKSSISIANSLIEALKNASLNNKIHNNEIKYSDDETNIVIHDFRERILSKNILDTSLTVEIFTNVILENEEYIKQNKYDYVIVDRVEDLRNSEIKLINKIQSSQKLLIISNEERYLDSIKKKMNLKSNNFKEIIVNLNNKKEKKEVKIEFNTDDENQKNKYIKINKELKFKQELNNKNYLIMQCKLIENINKLLDKKVKPNEILILTPYKEIIVVKEIERELNRKGFFISNYSDDRILDNKYTFSLAIGVSLYYKNAYNFKTHDFAKYFSIFFELDYITAYNIAREIIIFKNNLLRIDKKKIEEIKDNILKDRIKEFFMYLENKNEKNIGIVEFLKSFYVEKLLKIVDAKDSFRNVKRLIDRVEEFLQQYNKIYSNCGENVIFKAFFNYPDYLDCYSKESLYKKEGLKISTINEFLKYKSISNCKYLIIYDASNSNWLNNIKENEKIKCVLDINLIKVFEKISSNQLKEIIVLSSEKNFFERKQTSKIQNIIEELKICK